MFSCRQICSLMVWLPETLAPALRLMWLLMPDMGRLQ